MACLPRFFTPPSRLSRCTHPSVNAGAGARERGAHAIRRGSTAATRPRLLGDTHLHLQLGDPAARRCASGGERTDGCNATNRPLPCSQRTFGPSALSDSSRPTTAIGSGGKHGENVADSGHSESRADQQSRPRSPRPRTVRLGRCSRADTRLGPSRPAWARRRVRSAHRLITAIFCHSGCRHPCSHACPLRLQSPPKPHRSAFLQLRESCGVLGHALAGRLALASLSPRRRLGRAEVLKISYPYTFSGPLFHTNCPDCRARGSPVGV